MQRASRDNPCLAAFHLPFNTMKSLPVAFLFIPALLATPPVAVAGADSSTLAPAASAATSWATLQNLLPSSSRPGAPGQAPDWTGIAAAAGAFQKNFPDDAHATAAERIALVAAIHADDDHPQVAAETLAKVAAFLADTTNPIRDRLEVTIASAQATLHRTPFKTRAERLAANEAHARDLIQKFPSEIEGYGYLLGQAKAEESTNARAIIKELLASDAPAAIKADAANVQARLDLEGKPLRLTGAETAITAARGHVLVVFAWTSQDAGYLPVIQRLSQNASLRFIGLNLDSGGPDRALTSSLPGLQLREPAGLNGPAARQLQLLMTPSVYLVDPQGIVQDVNAFVTAEDKVAALVAKGGNS